MTTTLPAAIVTATDADGAVVAIRPGGSKMPIFCVHAAAGHLRLFHNLAQHLDPRWTVYGIRGVLRGRGGRVPYSSFEEMARRYADELRAVEPDGPYVIVGECSGGQLAYELARQLRDNSQDVALLVLIDSYGPAGPRLRRFVPRWAYRQVDTTRMLLFHLRAVAQIGAGSRGTYVSARLKRAVAAIVASGAARRGHVSEELVRKRGFEAALRTYRPSPYDGRVALLRGSRLPWGVRHASDLGWGDFAADLEITEVSCYFGTSLLEPAVHQVADHLGRALEAPARERTAG